MENESISDSSPSVLLITIENLQEEALNQSFYIGNIDLVDSKSDFLISDVLLFDYSFGKWNSK